MNLEINKIGQLTKCLDCEYESIRWVDKKHRNNPCFKCGGLVDIIGETEKMDKKK